MRIRTLCAALALVPLAASGALAQGMPSMFNSKSAGPPPTRTVPPPALPGTASAKETAPAQRPAADMEPTEALFDAINRGDIGAAREAISRGADLRGRNVLGMSPIELSVDLGRNVISFMLLSMRGAEGLSAQQAAPAPVTTGAKPPPTKQARQVPARQPPSKVASAPP